MSLLNLLRCVCITEARETLYREIFTRDLTLITLIKTDPNALPALLTGVEERDTAGLRTLPAASR